MSDQSAEISQLHLTVQSLNEQLAKNNSDMLVLKHTHQELLNIRDKAVRECRELNQRLSETEAKYRKLQNESSESRKTVSFYRSECDKNKARAESILNDYKAVVEQKNEVLRQLQQLKDSLSDSEKKYAEINAHFKASTQEVTEMDEKAALLEKQKHEIEVKLEDSIREVAQLKSKLTATEENLAAARKEAQENIDVLQESVSRLIEQQRASEQEKTEMQQRYEGLLKSMREEHQAAATQDLQAERQRLTEQMNKQQNDASEKFGEIQKQLAEAKRDADEQRQLVQELEKAVEAKAVAMEDLERQLDEHQQRLASTTRGSATEKRVYSDRLVQLEKSITQKQKEWETSNAAAQKQINELQTKLREEQSQRTKMEQTASNLAGQLEKAEKDAAEMKKAKTALEQQLREFQMEREEFRLQAEEDFLAKTGVVTKEADTLRQTVRDNEQRVRELEGTQSLLQATLDQVRRDTDLERRVLRSDMVKQRQTADRLQQENQALHEENAQLKDAKDRLEAELEERRAADEDRTTTAESLRNDIQKVQQLKADLDRAKTEVMNDKKLSEAANAELKRQHAEMEERVSKQQKDLTSLQQQRAAEIAERDGRIIALQAELNRAKADVEVLEAKLKDSEAEVADGQQRLRRLRTDHAVLVDQKRALDQRTNDTQQEIETFKNQVTVLEAKKKMLEDELEETRVKAERELESTSSQVRLLKSKLNDAQGLAESRFKRLEELEHLYSESNKHKRQILADQTTKRVLAEDNMLTTQATLAATQLAAQNTQTLGNTGATNANRAGSTTTPGRRRGLGMTATPIANSGGNASNTAYTAVSTRTLMSATSSRTTPGRPPLSSAIGSSSSSSSSSSTYIPTLADGALGALQLKTSTASALSSTIGRSAAQQRLAELLRKRPIAPTAAITASQGGAEDAELTLDYRVKSALPNVALSEATRTAFPFYAPPKEEEAEMPQAIEGTSPTQPIRQLEETNASYDDADADSNPAQNQHLMNAIFKDQTQSNNDLKPQLSNLRAALEALQAND